MPNVPTPQPVSSYVKGDTWTPQFSYTVGGVATDAASLTVRVERPDRTYYDLTYGTDAALVRLSAGVYVAAIPLTMANVGTRRWTIRALATVATSAGTITRYLEWWADCVASRQTTPN